MSAFGNSLADRGEFYGTLKDAKLDVTSLLILPSNGDDLPLMPSADKIGACKRTSKAQKSSQAVSSRPCFLANTMPS